MIWVTRARPKTDRIACPWLIRRFIDPEAEIHYVPAGEVLSTAEREGGRSFDAPGADFHLRRPLRLVLPRRGGAARVMSRPAIRSLAFATFLTALAGCGGGHGPTQRSSPASDSVATATALSLPSAGSSESPTSTAPGGLPLHEVADVPMPGPSVRFDYQDVDVDHRRLYIAHLGANRVVAVDVERLTVAGTVEGVANVHGVRVAPDLDRVFATATGTDQVVAIQASSLTVAGRAPTGRFPDGVAYDPTHKAVFVSNKDAGSETIVDAATLAVRRTVRLAGEVGNVIWDPAEQRMLVGARPPDQLLLLDPDAGQVTGRVDLPGCSGAHGVAVDPATHTAFVACERNARLAIVDLTSLHQRELEPVGDDPDVLAFDPGLSRLYVAAESGVVAVFDEHGPSVHKVGQAKLADEAHTVAVDPTTHRVFFPLENVHGHPVLRVMAP
ncbi:MAG: chromate resistance protein [Actinobacteria bacterium]|nr:chromate resistance protein [Actinomycetota bacterium]